MRIGYAAIAEEHPGSAIVEHVVAAETAGFAYASVSDHLHPWLDEEGHSPFAWSVLGGLAARVGLPLMTAVTCPLVRYHPLVIAQAGATVAEMASGGFTLGLGTGVALNEHAVGQPRHGPRQRLEQLREGVDVIRTAWDGDVYCYEVGNNGQAVPKASQKHEGPVLCSDWSHDGTAVFSGGCDNKAQKWDLATNTPTQVAQHDAPIKELCWIKEVG